MSLASKCPLNFTRGGDGPFQTKLLGDGDVHIEWCRVFFPNKDKMKDDLTIMTMQQNELERY